MTPSLRVGVLGAGYWGRNLVRNFASLGALGAICDVDPAVHEDMAANYPRAARYTTVDEFLDAAHIDAVVIATPAATHAALARQALAAGKHVFVEKPLALTAAEADGVREQLARTDRQLMVGHLLLYHPAFEALECAVRDGQLGELRYMYSNRLSLGRIRREENSLWSFAPHDIAMYLELVGRMPTRVAANGSAYLSPGVADSSVSYMKFGDGIEAHIFVSWLHPFKDHRLVVIGSDGMIVFNDAAEGNDKLLLYPHTARWEDDVPVVLKAPAEQIAYERVEPLRRECEHFIRCIRDNQPPRSGIEEGCRVLQVLDACQRSMATGVAVEL